MNKCNFCNEPANPLFMADDGYSKSNICTDCLKDIEENNQYKLALFGEIGGEG